MVVVMGDGGWGLSEGVLVEVGGIAGNLYAGGIS